jgi:tRNA U34 5-carboxymethylaminomethyl modifying GTPase MnmE/TrmE
MLRRFIPLLARYHPKHNFFCFSKRAKTAQLILHPPEQIQSIIAKKERKDAVQPLSRPWKSNVEGEGRFRVSLVGLPNCGKSSLFNSLVGEHLAVVDPHRGTTRDRK